MIAIVTVTTISPIWAQWTYSQSSGALSLNGKKIATGYAGKGKGVNNPSMQCVRKVGPVPRGTYTIGPAHNNAHTGALSMVLTPNPGNNMCGRGDFLIHGDNSRKPPRSSSEGCIVLPGPIRQKINATPGRKLVVVQ